MVWKKNRTRFKWTLFLEYWWIKKELVSIYSEGMSICMKCGSRKDLEIHHLLGDGDAERAKWEVGTNSPRTMGYLYHMYFEYQERPEEAKKHYTVLCATCNKLDRDARMAYEKHGEDIADDKKKNIILEQLPVPAVIPAKVWK